MGELLDWRRWVAIVVGFAGVLLVTRPGAGGIHPAALLMFVGALCYAVYGIMTRALARTDSNETTLFYTNLVGVTLRAADPTLRLDAARRCAVRLCSWW